MTPAELVTTLLTLVPALGRGDLGALEAPLGAQFARLQESPYMTVWQAPGVAPVARWELRLPAPGASFGGLLIADFPAPGLTAASLAPALDRLGPAELDIISPGLEDAPAGGMPAYGCYRVKAAKLCIGWMPGAEPRATSLTLETFAR